MTKGSTPGKRLSLPMYLEITESPEFKTGLWRESALCTFLVDKDPQNFNSEDWFPGKPTVVSARITTICGECDVRLECLSYAITLKPQEGIWAGHTDKGVRRMARKLEGRK